MYSFFFSFCSPKDVSYELEKARRELLKVDNYKTPRDKAVVFSNTCKIIFDMCCNVGKRSCSADDFFPYMVLPLLKTNPPNLISNIKYTREFRSPDQMQNEALFFLTNIFSAVSFILSMNAESLSITPGFYEKLVHQSPPKYFSFQDVALDLTINGGVCGPTDSDDIELAVAAGMTGENDDDAATAAAVVSHFAQKKSVFNRSMTFLTTDSEDVLSKFTFYECRYEDLKVRDVEELLRQYKELYKIVEGNVKHKKIFDSADNDSSTTTSKSTVDTHFIPTTSPI